MAASLRASTQAEQPQPSVALAPPSQFLTERTTQQLSTDLITRAQGVIEQAEREGRDPETELRQIVGDTILDSMRAGQQMRDDERREPDGEAAKRPKI